MPGDRLPQRWRASAVPFSLGRRSFDSAELRTLPRFAIFGATVAIALIAASNG